MDKKEQRVGSTYFGVQEIQHGWEMKEIIRDKPNNTTFFFLVCQFVAVDVYQGTAVFKHHLMPTSFGAHWCNTVIHRIEKHIVFIFLGFLCQILFTVGLGQKCAGFGI